MIYQAEGTVHMVFSNAQHVCLYTHARTWACVRTHARVHTHTYIYWLTHKDAAFAIANPRKDVIPPVVDLMSFLQSE